jgi:outer membrane protein
MPDVLNARVETSQAVFNLESAAGEEKIARVTLAEELGVEPSPNIVIDAQKKNRLAIAESKKREAEDELTDKHDQAQREVWTGFIAFRTAQRQQQAAVALLDSASTSYSASLDAYKYGVKNLVDVVTAEKQLALARLSSVSVRSQLFLLAAQLEFVTGNLLRSLPPGTKLQTQDGQKQ